MKKIIATVLLIALLSAFGGCQMPNKSDEPINPANGAGQTSETEAEDETREKKAPGSGKYNEGQYANLALFSCASLFSMLMRAVFRSVLLANAVSISF